MQKEKYRQPEHPKSANLTLRTVDVGRVKGEESRSHFHMLIINQPQDIRWSDAPAPFQPAVARRGRGSAARRESGSACGYRSTYGEPGHTLLQSREIRKHKGTRHGENIGSDLRLAPGFSVQSHGIT